MTLMKHLLLALAVAAPAALAQGTLEIIPLRHRTVEQVLPVLHPLLEPGGTLTGQSSQLIVRTSPRNLAEIKQALAAIDRPLRRLQILVRFDTAAGASREAIEARGTVRAGDATISNRRAPAQRSEASVRVEEQRSSLEERVDQRVQVLEGGRAFISTGQSRPLRQREVVRTPEGVVMRETTVMQDLATGFEVVPRVSGDRVFLDIAPQRETPGALPGSVQSQRVASTVSARLGEWFEIGGAASGASRDDRGVLSATRSSAEDSRRVWVKVEELRD
jgi:type II secretory pathway component GspD/PulD (secretin)